MSQATFINDAELLYALQNPQVRTKLSEYSDLISKFRRLVQIRNIQDGSTIYAHRLQQDISKLMSGIQAETNIDFKAMLVSECVDKMNTVHGILISSLE